MAEVGLLRVRARVGDRARGLQSVRRRLELPPARQGAQQGLPLGGRRHCRPLRSLSAPDSLAGILERARSDPQGADVRVDLERRQPRRGRQGVLLLPRRDADRQLHEAALQVSARGVSVRTACRGEPPPRRRRHGVRAPGYRRVRWRPLLRHRHRVRESGPGGHLRPRRGVQSRGRRGGAPFPAAVVVQEHVGLGRGTRGKSDHHARQKQRRRPPVAGAHRRRLDCRLAAEPDVRVQARPAPPLRPAGRHAALHRQRNQRRNCLRSVRALGKPVHEGRVPPSDCGRRAVRQPRRRGHEGGACTTRPRCRAADLPCGTCV